MKSGVLSTVNFSCIIPRGKKAEEEEEMVKFDILSDDFL